ncbi:MAG: HAD-IIA family hydrolase [Acidimicrobiia bacterium]|nr:HAD-IIA family hydrolase [Acidimicrobiia bacterium]NNL96862.1 HAD-IIA family hydrolase [Acidimicrobiia bacterium]
MIERPDAIVCDLDGVLYRGDVGIAGAGEALAGLHGVGIEIVFVTNNSTKTPAEAAAKITRLTGFEAHEQDVVTSAQAAAHLLAADAPPTLLFGAAGARGPLEHESVPVVADWQDARAVVAGLDLSLTYESLTRAVMAVERGARFVATNTDVTYPTPEGLWPGAGALVAAVEAATGVAPEVAGKPHAPMRSLLEERLAGRRVAVIGDRVETDIALGAAEGWTTILVLSGVTSSPDGADPKPDHVVASIAGVPELLGL